MSVDLTVHWKDGSEDDSIPVAGSSSFSEYWLNPSKELGIQKSIEWLTGMMTDDKQGIIKVVEDLYILREHTQLNQTIDDGWKNQVLSRMSSTIALLEKALANWENVDGIYAG